jgi:D-aspartate ligase
MTDSAMPAVAVLDNYWAPTLSFALSLGPRAIPLHFYGRGAGRWSRYCTRRLSCPPFEDAERFIPWLEQRVCSGEITRLAPTSDIVAYYLALLRDRFPPDVQRSIVPLEEIEQCLIKTRFASACAHAGQAVPAALAPEDPEGALAAAKQLGYPLMLKPKSHLAVGTSERGTVVRDRRELLAAFRSYPIVPGQEAIARQYPELRWPLLQRYIPSARRRVYSVSGFKDAQNGIVTAALSVKRWQWPPDTGTSTSQVSSSNAKILTAGLAAVDKLLSRGFFELELLVDHSQLLAIDLNPRAFGFMALDLALGNDLPWLWYQSTRQVVTPLTVPKSARVIEARFSIPHAVGRGILRLFGRRFPAGPSKRHGSAPRRVLPMLGHWSDPLPLIVSNARLLRHPGGLMRPFVAAARQEREAHERAASSSSASAGDPG